MERNGRRVGPLAVAVRPTRTHALESSSCESGDDINFQEVEKQS